MKNLDISVSLKNDSDFAINTSRWELPNCVNTNKNCSINEWNQRENVKNNESNFYTPLKTKIVVNDDSLIVQYHVPTMIPDKKHNLFDDDIYHAYTSFLFSFSSTVSFKQHNTNELLYQKTFNFVCPPCPFYSG
jgi:hypothetical protein